ncbi:317_t:CDS:1, partial [Ambispora leptoticha]
ALRKLQHAKITDKQAIYIINSVILTALPTGFKTPPSQAHS